MDEEQAVALEAALERMRAAFDDIPDEQLLEDVVEIVRRDRQEQRHKTGLPTSA
ncbi:MAG: hypothetical protein IT429_14155 [Gemmataceae bacterium]|nr:hypothetical protein [Gemmataceae bacterium]